MRALAAVYAAPAVGVVVVVGLVAVVDFGLGGHLGGGDLAGGAGALGGLLIDDDGLVVARLLLLVVVVVRTTSNFEILRPKTQGWMLAKYKYAVPNTGTQKSKYKEENVPFLLTATPNTGAFLPTIRALLISSCLIQ